MLWPGIRTTTYFTYLLFRLIRSVFYVFKKGVQRIYQLGLSGRNGESTVAGTATLRGARDRPKSGNIKRWIKYHGHERSVGSIGRQIEYNEQERRKGVSRGS